VPPRGKKHGGVYWDKTQRGRPLKNERKLEWLRDKTFPKKGLGTREILGGILLGQQPHKPLGPQEGW